jgi:membrane protein DedA with SNARE-associated domain
MKITPFRISMVVWTIISVIIGYWISFNNPWVSVDVHSTSWNLMSGFVPVLIFMMGAVIGRAIQENKRN